MRKLAGCAVIGVLALLVDVSTVQAQEAGQQAGQRIVKGERYIPAIWVDPDGCEHWVMDDGAEGFMSPHLTREGLPVCREVELCNLTPSDQMFATDSASITPAGAQGLREFFRNADAASFTIIGHTDSRGADQYNLRLSLDRANAVAEIARSEGARIEDVRGHGERMPKASNDTAEGMAQNRRVEIMCRR